VRADINECETIGGAEGHRCGANTICNNTQGSYECLCIEGYRRVDNFTCEEHDECSTGAHGCHANARCHNTPGQYECICQPGYEGDGFNCTREFLFLAQFFILKKN